MSEFSKETLVRVKVMWINYIAKRSEAYTKDELKAMPFDRLEELYNRE